MQKGHHIAAAELDQLEEAESAARAGETSRVLDYLKGAGSGVIEFASKVGTSVVAKLVEKQVGL